MAKLVLCSDDLMFAGKISSTARAHQVTFRTIGTLDAWRKLATDEIDDAPLVLLDLASVVRQPQDWVPLIRQIAPHARVIAFGPHVDAEKLEAALAAGCDTVLTRGQFQQQFDGLIAQLAKLPDNAG